MQFFSSPKHLSLVLPKIDFIEFEGFEAYLPEVSSQGHMNFLNVEINYGQHFFMTKGMISVEI